MANDKIRALQVDDTEITTPVVGNKALRSTCADDSTLEVNSETGALRMKPQGTSLAGGASRTSMSKTAGTSLQGTLTASDAAAGIFSRQNTYGSDLRAIVTVDVTTVSTGACTIDIGTAATAISSDNLIDGLDVNAAVGMFSSLSDADAGTNGKAVRKWKSTEWITASMATGATADLVGTYVVEVLDLN